MKTAVVILNFNGQHYLEKYLPTLISTTVDAEIVIADNHSSDNSVEWLRENYPNIRLIILEKNWGFAEGYNLALKQIEAEYYVLLNSDIRTTDNWLQAMIAYLDNHPECAACQPKILSELEPEKFEYAGASGGFIDKYGYPFCRGRIFGNVEVDNNQYDEIIEIFWATGASLVIRSKDYWEAGGLDGRFFAHQEEIDLCWRLKSRGLSIVCIPQSKIYHIGGGSLSYESPFKTKLNFRNNAILLYKNQTTNYYFLIRLLRIILDMVAALQMLLQRKPQNAKAVITANIEFIKLKKQFKQDRIVNKELTTEKKPIGLLNYMLLWQVYICKKREYKQYIKLLEHNNK